MKHLDTIYIFDTSCLNVRKIYSKLQRHYNHYFQEMTFQGLEMIHHMAAAYPQCDLYIYCRWCCLGNGYRLSVKREDTSLTEGSYQIFSTDSLVVCFTWDFSNVVPINLHTRILSHVGLTLSIIYIFQWPKAYNIKGWVMWEVWGGKTKNTTLFALPHSESVRLTCDLCPSKSIKTGWSLVATCFVKCVSSHSMKTTELDQPDSVTVPAEPGKAPNHGSISHLERHNMELICCLMHSRMLIL